MLEQWNIRAVVCPIEVYFALCDLHRTVAAMCVAKIQTSLLEWQLGRIQKMKHRP